MYNLNTTYILFILLTLLINISGYTQIYNTQVEAKIELKSTNKIIEITGFVFNKTEINQSLRYVLSVIKNNPLNSNKSKNDQMGRLVLEPNQNRKLSKTTITANETNKIIILLLVYNKEDQLLGKDRIVINGDPEDNNPIIIEKNKENIAYKDVVNEKADGVVLRGIVLDETKTKPGRDFYKMFYSHYLGSNINGKKIVTIEEILILANTTGIRVLVGDEVVFSFLAKPQVDYLKENSFKAIKEVYMYFQKLKQEKNIVKHY